MGRSVATLNGRGLNLTDIEHTSQEEIDAYLTTRWQGRGPLYDQYAMSLMLDYAPDFAKLHWWAAEVFRTMPSDPDRYDPSFATPNSLQQLHSYMVFGWETGIRNQFRVLRRLGDFEREDGPWRLRRVGGLVGVCRPRNHGARPRRRRRRRGGLGGRGAGK